MVTANVLDPIHDTVDPTVWDAPTEHYPVLKPQHKSWIIDKVHDLLKEHGYGDTDKWLDLYLTGSLTTFQYSDDSDCDVSLFVNTDVFPEWSRAEMIGLMVSFLDGTPLPGTSHPMQIYVVAKGIRPQDLYKPGLRSGYQIQLDQWIVPPEKHRSHDVQSEQAGDYQYALEQADKMERLLRYEPHKAIQFWHQIHMRRQSDQKQGKGDYAQSNIIYKFLNNRGLFPQLEEASGEHIAGVKGNYKLWAEMAKRPGTTVPEVLGRFAIPLIQKGYAHPEAYTLARKHYGLPDIFEPPNTGDMRQAYPATKPEGWDERELIPKREKQDLRAQAATQPWGLNDDAIDRARKHLGIYHPVNVNLVEGHQGRYNGRVDGTHEIELVKWLRPEAASKQLWHELTHAKQFERDPKRWESYMRDYNRQYDRNPGGYRDHPWEIEATEQGRTHLWSLVHGFKTTWERRSNEIPRVLYTKFTPNIQHPITNIDRNPDMPFIYDPVDNIVHLGPPRSYHWELIQRAPELRAQYPMDEAFKGMSATIGPPNHLHGRMTMPDKTTDFMGLTDKNDYRDVVNQALGATSSQPKDWGTTFESTTNKGRNAGSEAESTSQPPSEEAWSIC